ncbi:hypothetical protein TSUD_185510 [Trifolium subterraneum]|uniref:RNase H type-1 domain-containing protein n=1 Tax=Trifolium subterraneum TaxID=3900 RepID=A0A2Z6NZ47_TRISU|nr:hypothetical protein TSUD_185510 [Trifolium subterraneum]
MFSIPWCIIGDFNDLLSQADKKGTSVYLDKESRYPHVIEERLDRAMASTSWLQLFPQRMWWLRVGGGRENLGVIDRVTRCANKLQRWGKKKRIRFKEEIDECVRRMNELRGNQDEEGSIQYQELSERHATLLIQEEGKKKKVTKLIADNGTEAHTQEELCEVATSYFDTLFKPRDGDHYPILNLIQPRVTDDDNLVLTAPITKVEIQQALFQMHPDKSPRPDGFNPAFYQRFWEQCSDDIFSAASTWLERGYFPTSLNDTNICLIPKCDNPTSMKDLRPISLFSFVEGRSILDNALIATEVIHALKRKTKGRRGELALKIDISKAYDKVDWGFLRGVMTRMGFTDVWIRADLHGVRICRGAPEVSHLLFADDCFLFCRASVAEAAKEDLSRILGVKLVLGTGIYLGLPSMVGRSMEIMIKSVLQAIPSYLMSIHWLAWERLACPKAYGGLGFRNFEAFNKAMVAKQVWNIVQNPNSLVAKLIKARYFPRSSLFEAPLGYNPSFAWRSMWQARQILSLGCRWRIGSGDNIRVMHDPWLRGSANRWVPSPQPAGVYQLSVRELLHDNYKAWNIFFRCAVAQDSWSAAGLSSVLHNATYQQTIAMDRIFAICSNESSDIVGRVAMLLWYIWQNRNDKLWNDNVQMPRQIGRHAFDAWNDWTSMGLCFRDNSGHFMAGMTQWQQTVISSVEGEAWALLLTMEEARHRRLNRVQFESDSKILIEAIHMKRRGNSEFLSIVHDILSLMSSFINFEVKFVRRQANLVAHTLARAANSWASFHRFENIPFCIERLVFNEMQ